MSLNTKLFILDLPVLLCGSEVWGIYYKNDFNSWFSINDTFFKKLEFLVFKIVLHLTSALKPTTGRSNHSHHNLNTLKWGIFANLEKSLI